MIRCKKVGIITGMILGVYIFMKYLLLVMSPFLLGWLFAILVYPFAVKICKKTWAKKLRITRTAAATFIILLCSGFILLLIWFLLKKCVDCMPGWIACYPIIENDIREFVQSCCCTIEEVTGILAADSSSYLFGQMDKLKNMVFTNIQPQVMMGHTISSIKYIMVCISSVILSVVSGILFVKDYEVYRDKLSKFEFCTKFWNVLTGLVNGAKKFFLAQIEIMSIIGIICILGFWILGSPHFLLFGLLLGLVDALPILGTGIVLVPLALILLVKGATGRAIGYAVLFLVTSCTRQFLEPKLIGEHLGISPIFVLAAIYLGVFVYGGAGVLLGPVSALLIWGILKEWEVLT